MIKIIRFYIALFHLNDKIVCEESERLKSVIDFHDYKDSIEGEPWHFVLLQCKRCGKYFRI